MAENIELEKLGIQTNTYGKDIRQPIYKAISILFAHKGSPYPVHEPITKSAYDAMDEHDPNMIYPISSNN